MFKFAFLILLCSLSLYATPKKTPPAVHALQSTKTQSVSVLFQSGGHIRLEGDSTMHTFAATATSFDLSARAESPQKSGVLDWRPTNLEMVLPVKNLKSGDDGLDERMWAALKTSDIKLSLQAFRVVEKSVEADGQLTIAGVTKPVTLKAELTAQDKIVSVVGEYDLKMSDYGIEPPTMMAVIRVADAIKIKFEFKCALDERTTP